MNADTVFKWLVTVAVGVGICGIFVAAWHLPDASKKLAETPSADTWPKAVAQDIRCGQHVLRYYIVTIENKRFIATQLPSTTSATRWMLTPLTPEETAR